MAGAKKHNATKHCTSVSYRQLLTTDFEVVSSVANHITYGFECRSVYAKVPGLLSDAILGGW